MLIVKHELIVVAALVVVLAVLVLAVVLAAVVLVVVLAVAVVLTVLVVVSDLTYSYKAENLLCVQVNWSLKILQVRSLERVVFGLQKVTKKLVIYKSC